MIDRDGYRMGSSESRTQQKERVQRVGAGVRWSLSDEKGLRDRWLWRAEAV